MNIFNKNKDDYDWLNQRIDNNIDSIQSCRQKINCLAEENYNLKLYLFKDIYDYQKYKGKHFIFNHNFFDNNYYENKLVNELLKRTFGFGEIYGNCKNDVVTWVRDENTLINKENGYCLSELIEDMEKYAKEKKEK